MNPSGKRRAETFIAVVTSTGKAVSGLGLGLGNSIGGVVIESGSGGEPA
jgi:hypothetical protein